MMNQELVFPMLESVLRDAPFIGLKMAWEAIESLVYMYGDGDKEINQCDGCRRNLPVVDGIHQGQGYDLIACTKVRY